MKIWQFIYNFIILIFLFNKVGTVNKKLQKSFDEIFGEGWEERKTEEAKLGNECMDQAGLDQHLAMEPHADQNRNFNHNIDEESHDQNTVGQGNDDQSEDDRRKGEIIRKFRLIKEKIKQKGIKYPKKEWTKIDCTIATKLGTNRSTIYSWIKEFGMGMRKIISKGYSDQQKREIILKYAEIKEKIKQKGRKYPSKEWTKIEAIIANKLGTNRFNIYKWRKEFGMMCREKIKDISTKIEIIQQFMAICNEYKQKRTYSKKEWEQNYAKISKKLGVGYGTIQKWKKEFGISRKKLTNEERSEIMKRYWTMKRTNPMITDRKIAKIFEMDPKKISKWKCRYRDVY